METKINKQIRGEEEVSPRPDTGGLSANTSGMAAEKVGTAHLTSRISELSIFGLLWG